MFAAIKEAASQLAEKTEEGVGLLATHLSEEGRHKARLAREAAEIERRNEEACREGFARKRAVWFREWKRDLGFYLDNQHSLIAAFRGHSLHPFSRAHRAAHVFCVLGLNIFLAALVAQRYPLMQDPNHYLAVALAAFLNLIYDQILRMLASAPCAEKGGCCDCFCCRDLCRGLGSISLYLALAASLAVGVLGCVVAYSLPPSTQLFTIFWLVKGLAWGFELLTLLVSFYRKREQQREQEWGQKRARKRAWCLAGGAARILRLHRVASCHVEVDAEVARRARRRAAGACRFNLYLWTLYFEFHLRFSILFIHIK